MNTLVIVGTLGIVLKINRIIVADDLIQVNFSAVRNYDINQISCILCVLCCHHT